MASNKFILSLIFVALILCQGFQGTDGVRNLKFQNNNNNNNVVHPSKSNDHDDVDDFKPTEPGHSPGVGHSIHN